MLVTSVKAKAYDLQLKPYTVEGHGSPEPDTSHTRTYTYGYGSRYGLRLCVRAHLQSRDDDEKMRKPQTRRDEILLFFG